MKGKLTYKFPLTVAAAAVVVGAVLSPLASANTTTMATWTGAAGDNRFSTAGNWKEGVIPTTGAKLMLPCDENNPLSLTNDLQGVKFSGIETSSPSKDGGPGCAPMTIDTIDFEDSITLDSESYRRGSVNLRQVSGAAERVQLGSGEKQEMLFGSGSQMINTKHLVAKNTPALIKPSVSVDVDSASITWLKQFGSSVQKTVKRLYMDGDTYDGDITIKDGGKIYANYKSTWNDNKKENEITETKNELSGKITLLGNATYEVDQEASLKLSGSIDGENFALTPQEGGSWGDFENATNPDNSNTPKGKQEFKAEEVDLKKECATERPDGKYFTVGRNQFAVLSDDSGCEDLTGIIVIEGLLKGVGTVEYLTVRGTLAPGNSAGTITVKEALFFDTNLSVFDVEIFNKDTYDKVIVGKEYNDQYGGNAVNIATGATLKLTYLEGGSFKKGDVITIIDNQSKTDVKGEFKDMPEGAEVVVGNATFKISYKGGDGNDVTLEALNDSEAPKAPNTGMASLVANPVAAVVATVMSVAALAMATKRKATGRR